MIGVIYIDSGWILQTIGTKICEADDRFTPIPMSVAQNGPRPMDAYYYIDVQNCWHPAFGNARPEAKHVGMFTHLDQDDPGAFRPGWEKLDGVVHMCERYERIFDLQAFYHEEQMTVIVPGEVSHMSKPDTVFGIVQRGGHVGKGSEFFPKVIETLPQSVREAMSLNFCGDGWGVNPYSISHPQVYHGVLAEGFIEDAWLMMYDLCDYIIIPSLWEGGPMALLEALASKTGVIAADVGFVADFYREWGYGTDHFKIFPPGNVHLCAQAICEVVAPRVKMRSIVENLSYKNYAEQVYRFIQTL